MGIETAVAGASAGLSAVSTGLGFFGAGQKADATADSYMYKAMVAKQNQLIADQQADRQVQAGQVGAFNNDLKARAQLGTARADIGASGFAMSGTKLDALDSAHTLDRYDSLQIVDNANRAAYGTRLQGYNFGMDAYMDEKSANNAKRAGGLDQISSLVSGASSLASKWSKYQNQGVV